MTCSYLICATPRTGSFLLCDALAATGVAGKPTEYLMPSYRDHWTAQWGTSTDREYHDRALTEGATPNGVFGTKIHSGQLVEFLRRATGKPRPPMEDWAAVLSEWFPRPGYIWLRRRDQVRQAVSWTRACQTRIWWDSDTPPAPPMGVPQPDARRFDYQFIERAMYSLVDWDGVWRTYFDSTGIEPITVWYEDLISDRPGAVARVIDYLGLKSQETLFAQPRFRSQSDETSTTWATRFGLLHSAKRESTLASFGDVNAGEVVYVCMPGASSRIPRDAVTIAVDGGASPAPASYALLTHTPVIDPSADVVFTIGQVKVNHPFVVRLLVDQPPPKMEPIRNRLAMGDDGSARGLAASLAIHLGARHIQMA